MPDRGFTLSKILVATDFSESAAAALRRALALAGKTAAEVTVLHVLEEGTSPEVHGPIPPAEFRQAANQDRRQAAQLDQWVAPYSAALGTLRTEVRVGVPFVEIIRAAQEQAADLVLAGTQGLSGLKRILVGSTAERLVRKCPCPVWVVKRDHDGPLRALLAPVDFSVASAKSLRLAAGLAELFACPLTVLYVVDFPDKEGPLLVDDKETARGDIRQRRRRVRQAAAGQMEQFVAAHVSTPIDIRPRLALGTPWRVITTTARRLAVDLVVMGSVARTGIPGFFIGNTAEKVLRQTDRSILAVKPEGFMSPVTTAP